MKTLLLLALPLFASQAAQASEDLDRGKAKLFVIDKFDQFPYKADSNTNAIQVQVPAQNCRIAGKLDYYWLMNYGASKKEMDDRIKVGTRSRIHEKQEVPPGHGAACPEGSQSTCQAISLTSRDLNMVNHGLKDPRIVVKMMKLPSGNCVTVAFIDDGEKLIQIKTIDVKAATLKRRIGFPNSSADVRIDSVQVFGYGEGVKTPVWTCDAKTHPKRCVETVSVPTL